MPHSNSGTMTENKFINTLMYLHVVAVKIDPQGEIQLDFRKVGFIIYTLFAGLLPAIYGYSR